VVLVGDDAAPSATDRRRRLCDVSRTTWRRDVIIGVIRSGSGDGQQVDDGRLHRLTDAQLNSADRQRQPATHHDEKPSMVSIVPNSSLLLSSLTSRAEKNVVHRRQDFIEVFKISQVK